MTDTTLATILQNQIDPAQLHAHLVEFSRRVKLSGTPAELESFLYLRAQLDAYGFRTTLLSHDAYISLPGPARAEVEGVALRCITHSMSHATPAEGVAGPLIYVGVGDQAGFAGQDVRGAIVLVDGIAHGEIADLATKYGAIGQLHISPTEHLYEMCASTVWGSPSLRTRDTLPRTVLCTIDRDTGAGLRARCQNGEAMTARLWAEVDTGWRKTPLLVAEADALGAGADAPFVMLSGHHDTWHYGVMDNGSANATMLEAARLMLSQRAQWRRGLRICFWSGHSHGRYSGSAWYADEYWNELDQRCAAHVNVDSTGGVGASVLTNSGVIDELKQVAAEEIFAVSGQRHLGKRQGRAADQSFWGVGIPSMFGSLSHQPPGAAKMLVALGWWWHTPEDLLERIDPANHLRDTAIIVRVLTRLLTSETLPLDYTATADGLTLALQALQPALANRLAIDDLLAATAQLRAQAASLQAVGISDAALMQVSRALVPINHTTGDRFIHDPAMAQPSWPSLEGLRTLAAMRDDDPDLLFALVDARRARNRIAQALRLANQTLATVLTPSA